MGTTTCPNQRCVRVAVAVGGRWEGAGGCWVGALLGGDCMRGGAGVWRLKRGCRLQVEAARCPYWFNPPPLTCLAPPHPPHPTAQIRNLLMQFDLDRDGTIDLAEWGAALMDWGAVEQRQEWETWVHKVGAALGVGVGVGVDCCLLQLLALPCSRKPARSGGDTLKTPDKPPQLSTHPPTRPPTQVFELFDRDHSNRISTEELAQVLCGGGAASDEELCIPDAVPAALRRVDADGDGFVDFQEFLNMLHTSDAEALELFPSRRLKRGTKRVAQSVAEQRQRAGGAA